MTAIRRSLIITERGKSMKRKDGFLLRKIDDTAIVVPVGETSRSFHGMITLNETGVFLWEMLSGETQADTLAQALCSTYQIDRETADRDVARFLEKAQKAGLLEE